MSEMPRSRLVVSSAAAFAATFVGFMLGLPIIGLMLGQLLAPVGLGGLAFAVYFPAFALWFGDLRFGHGDDATVAINGDGYRVIPVAVWLAVWVLFSWAARRLSGRGQVVAAACAIIAVTWSMHVVLRRLEIQFFPPNL